MSGHGSRCMYCAGSFWPGDQCSARTSPVGRLPCEAVMDVAMHLEALVDGDRNEVARLLAQEERDPMLQAVVSSWKQSGEVTHGDLLRAIRDLSEELCRVRLVFIDTVSRRDPPAVFVVTPTCEPALPVGCEITATPTGSSPMTNDEAIARIAPAPQGGLAEEMPTCGECGGWGLGYASVEHHHTCTVAAAITDWCTIVCGDEHWTGWLGHELPAKEEP